MDQALQPLSTGAGVMLIAAVTAFFVGMVLAPAVIGLMRRLKAGQTILSYVDQHRDKQGIPTCGGWIFLIASTVATLAFGGWKSRMCLVALAVFFAYGVIGFLDDFIKIRFHRNLGLRAYQKILSQLAVAVIAALFAAKHLYVGTTITLPLVGTQWEMGYLFYPFAVIVFLAMSNGVNLTDGLDGLAATTGSVYMIGYGGIFLLAFLEAAESGDVLLQAELRGMLLFLGAIVGGLGAFLWHNAPKATVFMGDTGSLALGGAAAAVAIFSRNPLISILIGIMFVVSCISVIVQVIVFKLRKKRVFLMAPFHHHLELKGFAESKIVAFYGLATAVATAVAWLIV